MMFNINFSYSYSYFIFQPWMSNRAYWFWKNMNRPKKYWEIEIWCRGGVHRTWWCPWRLIIISRRKSPGSVWPGVSSSGQDIKLWLIFAYKHPSPGTRHHAGLLLVTIPHPWPLIGWGWPSAARGHTVVRKLHSIHLDSAQKCFIYAPKL